jgi:hypothetical protein
MLATYRAGENPPPTELLDTTLPAPATSRAARHARQVRLALSVALRRAGYPPWLLAGGVLAMAALQEPMLLRAYGIRLPWQAAWPIGGALVAVLAAGLPTARSILSQVLSAIALVVIVATPVAAALAAVDVAYGRQGVLAACLGWGAGFALAFYQFAIVLAAVRRAPWPLAATATAGAALLAVVIAVRFDAGNWSLPVLAATLLAGMAAIPVARTYSADHHAHRHPR